MAKKTAGRPYRVSAELAEAAENKAMQIRKKTGKEIKWTDVIKDALKTYFGLL
jgi:hypothetical protein